MSILESHIPNCDSSKSLSLAVAVLVGQWYFRRQRLIIGWGAGAVGGEEALDVGGLSHRRTCCCWSTAGINIVNQNQCDDDRVVAPVGVQQHEVRRSWHV